MELFVVSLFLLLALFFSFFLSYLHKNKTKGIIDGAKFPPGNTGWPFIGESLEFIKAGRRGVPEEFTKDRMQKFSSQVFKTSLFGERVAVFCGAMGNKFLFTNHNKLVGGWWPRSVDKIFPSSQTTSSDESVKVRKLLPNFLKPEALQRYVGVMDVIARRHLETNWDNKKEVLACPLAKIYTLSLACRVFLSIDDPVKFEKFSEAFSILVRGIISIPIDLPGTRFNRGLKASNMIRKELQAIIKQRKIELAEKKVSPKQDILSQLLVASGEDGAFANEKDIASNILALLIAGHDTASSVITFIVKYLAEYPHVYDEVLKEQTKIAEMKRPGEMLNWDDIQKMKYSWNVACEVMRLASPSPGAFRVALTDFTYSGFSIPKGWKLYWSSYSTQMNPDYFPDPEKFDPSRFEGKGPAPYTFVPFGGGPKMCPGKEYARLEILVFMHHLVRKYKWEKSLPNEKIVVDPFPTPTKGLPVRLLPHNKH